MFKQQKSAGMIKKTESAIWHDDDPANSVGGYSWLTCAAALIAIEGDPIGLSGIYIKYMQVGFKLFKKLIN